VHVPFPILKKHYPILNKTTDISVKLQMDDILIPNAAINVVKLTMDAATSKLMEETKKKQKQVLKLKEVDENRLRMVVKL
jgi:hypothetical protein